MFLNVEGNPGVGASFGGRKGLVVFVVVAGLFLAGCQAGSKKVVKSPSAEDERGAVSTLEKTEREGQAGVDILPPDSSQEQVFLANIDSGRFDPLFVKSRLKLYGDKAEKWQILESKMRIYGLSREQEKQWQQCTGLLAELVAGYDAVLAGQGDSLIVTRKDISFAESNCDEMFGVYTALIPEMLATFQQEASDQAVGIIDYYAERKEYQQVVIAYENAKEFSGKALADLRLKEIYGRALLHTGRLEKAALVFSQVLAEYGPYEKWPLRLEVAELLIASGQYEKARAEYLHLAAILNAWEEINKAVTDKLALLFAANDHARELALYSQALHAFLSYDGNSIPSDLESAVAELQNKYPGGIHTSAAGKLSRQVVEQVRQNTALTLVKVERLADAKEFKKGLDILADLKKSRLPADSMIQVDEAISSINAAREHHVLLEKEQRVQDLADQWQEGLNLLDMELYDESISVFMELLGTEYDSQAAAEIEKASLRAAKLLRKKAAAIFIKVRKADDDASRKALLNESRELLQSILEKYPQVEIADKVADNLHVIDEQLRSLEDM
ncbi:MAG: hypothetical protein KKD73_07080 [Proteobacteria bacterium]|nr:hypothetical protein [Pseudomonadota bacterium]MBU1639436.1 hypothetical protein [Pseudomonadota bacterium]